MLNTNKTIRRISASISDSEIDLAKDYIKKAVHGVSPGKRFSVRSLFGGSNSDWNGTALQCIYDRHKEGGTDHKTAAKKAAKDVGWLLKAVLDKDAHPYSRVGKESGAVYVRDL